MTWTLLVGIAWISIIVGIVITAVWDEMNQTEEQKEKSKKFRERLDYKHPDKD